MDEVPAFKEFGEGRKASNKPQQSMSGVAMG